MWPPKSASSPPTRSLTRPPPSRNRVTSAASLTIATRGQPSASEVAAVASGAVVLAAEGNKEAAILNDQVHTHPLDDITACASMEDILRLRQAVLDVRISDEVAQPVTLGRHILLPRDAEEWDDTRLTAVLLHERAHVARHDSLLALLADLSTAVYWFHPLAWLAARRTMLDKVIAASSR